MDKLLVQKFLSERKQRSAQTTVQSERQNTANCSVQYKYNHSRGKITLVAPSDYPVYLLQYHMPDKQYPMHLLNHMLILAISSPLLIEN